MTDALGDQAARDRISRDLAATLFVEAGAGTGKTTELVGRIVALVRSGVSVDGIAAITFTEKAAAELSERVRRELERAATGHERYADFLADERARCQEALPDLDRAAIQTLHSFAQRILSLYPLEAGLPPQLRIMDEVEGDIAFRDRWRRFVDELLDEPAMQRPLLRAFTMGLRLKDLERVAEAFHSSWERLDGVEFEATEEPEIACPPLGPALEAAEAALGPKPSEAAMAQLRRLHPHAAKLDAAAARIAAAGDGGERDAAEVDLLRLACAVPEIRTNVGPKGVFATTREAHGGWIDAARRAYLTAVLPRLKQFALDYAAERRTAGHLSFQDLLALAVDLLRTNPQVRRALHERYQRVLIDEFQDTDPLQAEILLLLAADDPAEDDWKRARVVPGKLFVVGDPKQSIYRFRRADVVLYREIAQRLVERDGAELLHLTTSFRAVPSIQTAVNAAFERAMAEGQDSEQAPYVPLTPFRAEIEGQPTVVALPVPRPYSDYGKITKWSIDASLPDAIAAFVHWLVTQSGWTIEAGGRRVPIAPRHVCILMRQFKSWEGDRTADVVKALEARRVAHVLLGGRSFHDREEVIAVRSALCAIEWPDDGLSVYATLRGPLFALGDDTLLAFRAAHGSLHPLRRIAPEALSDDTRPVAEALAILARLHLGRSRRPISDTLARLLEATRAHAGIAIWPRGEQALANVLRVMSLAQAFEWRGTTSFRAFAQHLIAAADRAEAAEAPVVEEGTEGVRVMTAHKAKGLEFPIVVLADMTTNEVQERPSRWVDQARGAWLEPLAGCAPAELREHAPYVQARDREEAVRLAYVAATRARDLLVVPVVGDADAIDGWLRALSPAIYPAAGGRRAASPAPGCPAFGRDTVLERPPQAREPLGPVVPGEHVPEAGTHRVVFWDPARLELEATLDVGLRQQKILVADDGGLASDASIRAHDAWRAARAERLARGANPTVAVATVTRVAAEEAPAPEPSVAVELAVVEARRPDRPRGARFGSLVHATLAVVDLRADAALVRETAEAQGRLLGAERGEIDAAADAVVAALAHPLLVRAAKAERAGACRREAPLVVPRGPGEVLEGVVDLAFLESDAWVVVDFKTDADVEERRATYERQVALYADALAAVTERPARGVLLLV